MTRFSALSQAGTFGLPFVGYFLILQLPQAGNMGTALRYQFNFFLLALGGLIFLALLPKDRLGIATGLAAVLFLFALPLVGLWANAAGEMHVLGGMLYFSDTAGYYWDANRLLEGGLFSAFAARRPLFAGLLAGLLGLANHNLQFVLAVLVGLCGLSCYLAARELRQTHGPAAGAVFLLLLFLFYRRFIGTPDTENLGMILGAASFALLWRGARLANRATLLIGALLLTLALAARAGAFLVLPALVFWGAWQGKNFLSLTVGSRIKAAATVGGMLCAVIILGFLFNYVVFKTTSSIQDRPFANFAYTFYGMASGGQGWMQIYKDAPDLAYLPEAQAAPEIYRRAWGLIRQSPVRFSLTVLGQFADFFSLKDESVFGFASGADLVIFDSPHPGNAITYKVVRILLIGLSLAGMFWSYLRKDALHGLLLWLAGGIILSVAFLPPRDAGLMRVYAATIPLLAAIPAVGLACMIERARKPAAGIAAQASQIPIRGPGWAMPAYGLGLVVLIVTAPLLVRAFARPAPLPNEVSCLPGEETVTVRISPGAYIRLVDDRSAPRTWLPEVRRSDFIASLHSFPNRADLAGLEHLPTPVLMQNAIDLESGRAFWLILQDGPTVRESEVVTLCGTWSAGFRKHNFDFFFGVLLQG